MNYSRCSKNSIGHFVFGNFLSTGNIGSVRLGSHNLTESQVAIKIIWKHCLKKHNFELMEIKRIADELKTLDHDNILKLYNVIESNKNIFIILEYVDGCELFDYIKENGRFLDQELAYIFLQIVLALEHYHTHSTCYRALLPENLLLDKNKNIKLVALGLSQITSRWEQQFVQETYGSPYYSAPEVFEKGPRCSRTNSDVWSLGVIFYVMCTGRLPFNDDNIVDLMKNVMSGKFCVPFSVSPLVRDLVSQMLVVDEDKRIKLGDIRKHAFFLQYCPKFYRWQESMLASICFVSRMAENTDLCVPWADNLELQDDILKYMQYLGMGTTKQLQRSLLENNLTKDKEISTKQRIDRAIYMMLYYHSFYKRLHIHPRKLSRRQKNTSLQKHGEFNFQKKRSRKKLISNHSIPSSLSSPESPRKKCPLTPRKTCLIDSPQTPPYLESLSLAQDQQEQANVLKSIHNQEQAKVLKSIHNKQQAKVLKLIPEQKNNQANNKRRPSLNIRLPKFINTPTFRRPFIKTASIFRPSRIRSRGSRNSPSSNSLTPSSAESLKRWFSSKTPDTSYSLTPNSAESQKRWFSSKTPDTSSEKGCFSAKTPDTSSKKEHVELSSPKRFDKMFVENTLCAQSASESTLQLTNIIDTMKIDYKIVSLHSGLQNGTIIEISFARISITPKKQDDTSCNVSVITVEHINGPSHVFETFHMDILVGLQNIMFSEKV